MISTVQQRLYEARFRNAVLDAYRDHCAVCELHVRALLDAAHVRPGHDVGDGVALCATHHRAFDTGVLTFDGDYNVRIHVADPTLAAYEGKHLTLPADERQWPRRG